MPGKIENFAHKTLHEVLSGVLEDGEILVLPWGHGLERCGGYIDIRDDTGACYASVTDDDEGIGSAFDIMRDMIRTDDMSARAWQNPFQFSSTLATEGGTKKIAIPD